MPASAGVSDKVTTSFATSITSSPGVTTQASGSTFVIVVLYVNSHTLNTPTDSKSNTYTKIGSSLVYGSSSLNCDVYRCENGVGGSSHTFTASITGGADIITAFFLELKGVLTASVLDTAVTATTNDLATPFTVTAAGATSQADEILVSILAISGSGDNPVIIANSTGFTTQISETNGASLWCGAVGTKVVSSISTYNTSWTASNATDCGVVILGFKGTASTLTWTRGRTYPGPRTKGPPAARIQRTRNFGTQTTSPIQGAVVSPTIVAGSLAGAGALSGGVVTQAVIAGRIGGDLPATGAIIETTAVAGNLGGTANAQGIAALQTIVAGSAAGAGALSGVAVALTFVAGDIRATAALNAASVSTTYLVGVLADAVTGNLFAALVSGVQVAGAAQGAGALNAAVISGLEVAGNLAGTAAATAASVSITYVAGQLAATAAAQGAITAGSFLAGDLSSVPPGAINLGSVTFVTLAGELITLTPAGPEQVQGSGHQSRGHYEDELVTRATRFERLIDDQPDLRPPMFTPVSNEPSNKAPTEAVFTAAMEAELADLLARQQRARLLGLLILMTEMLD